KGEFGAKLVEKQLCVMILSLVSHFCRITNPQKYAMVILPTELFQAEMTSAICHTVLMLRSKANYRENKYLSYRLAKYLC
ncbi:hypothetical protein STEG23_019020, partial [Scotinomys teguina]